jgi:hypothetical protein
MGWMTYHRTPGEQTNAEHFAEKLGSHYQIVEHGTVHNVFYAAVRDSRDGAVDGLIILTQWTRGDFNFGYKDMGETGGPCYNEAPKSVLAALSPTDHEYALAWRAACEAHHAQRDFLRANLAVGDSVVFARPLQFTDGSSRDRLTYGPRGRLVLGTWSRFQVPGWRDTVIEVVKVDGTVLVTPAGRVQRMKAEALAA